MTYYKQSLEDLADIAEEMQALYKKIIFPEGQYQAVLVKTFEKMSKISHTKYYRWQFKIIEQGEYKNKMFFYNLNLNSTEKAKNYARKILKQMMISTEKDDINEFEDMANIPVTLHMSIRLNGEQKENGLWGIGKSKHTNIVNPYPRNSAKISVERTLDNMSNNKKSNDVPFIDDEIIPF